MPNFIKVEDVNSINLSSKWKDSKNFFCEGRFINKKNEYVKVSHPGPMYAVFLKKERDFTTAEKIMRFTKFIFFSLLTLGLCNLRKSFRELYTKNKMVVRYAVKLHLPKLDISEFQTKFKVNELMKKSKMNGDLQKTNTPDAQEDTTKKSE